MLDGEIVVCATETERRMSGLQPFAELQQRIGRKAVGAKLLRDMPVVLLAYDLLENEARPARACRSRAAPRSRR